MQEDLVVFKLGHSGELRERMLTDPALRTLITLAEGNRLLVARSDLSKLKRELKKLGYFVDSF